MAVDSDEPKRSATPRLEDRVREPEYIRRRKTLENEILREDLSKASKKADLVPMEGS